MDRIAHIDHTVATAREKNARTEELLRRRAATQSCERTGLLRLCAPAKR